MSVSVVLVAYKLFDKPVQSEVDFIIDTLVSKYLLSLVLT